MDYISENIKINMANTCSKFKKFTQTTVWHPLVGDPTSQISSESNSEDEWPMLSHKIGTEVIYTIEDEND